METPPSPRQAARAAREAARAADRARAAYEAQQARAEAAARAARAAEEAALQRPKKPSTAPLSGTVILRLSEADRATLVAHATAAATTVSDYLRDVLAGRRPPITPNP